ncbi:MAG: pyridoxamine 5'-phosphate oxidase family protein [Ruminococcus sp.]|nr:pyridoxamine 5'-phosphate oxidase family protein [Ruminococcus sp.]
MRRKDREVTDFKTIVGIIDECEIVRIGLSDGEYPYVVPLNFAYRVIGGRPELYIHGALAGRKYELMKKNRKCSFEMDIALKIETIPDKKDVTQRYKCVMGKADITFLEDKEKQSAMDNIIMARSELTKGFDYNKAVLARTMVARLDVTELTAKVNPINGNAD